MERSGFDSEDDGVQVFGLAALLDEDDPPPFLELRLSCRGSEFRAGIMAVEHDWALNVRDASGQSFPGSSDFYPTQSAAILAAMLTAHEVALHPPDE